MDQDGHRGSAGANGDGDVLAAVREVLEGADAASVARRRQVPVERLERWHRRSVELAMDAVASEVGVGASPASAPAGAAGSLVDYLLDENERLWDLVLEGRPG